MAQVLIAGCGYIGSALGERLAADGHSVWGLRRHPEELPAVIRGVKADMNELDPTVLPEGLDYVFLTVSASGFSEAEYRRSYLDAARHLIAALERSGNQPERILFTSSTSVYGQSEGEWVDETSPTGPESFAGRVMLETEAVLRNSPWRCVVLRLGGIYGPGRTRMIDQVREGRVSASGSEPVYTNRIHRDDAAGALRHLMILDNPQAIYLGVDDEPASKETIQRWLAETLGVSSAAAGGANAEAGSRRSSNKRCANERLVASGYRFKYPTFREGFAALLAQE